MKFKMPTAEELAKLTPAEIADLVAQAQAEVAVFQTRHAAGEDFTDDEVDRFEHLVQSADTLDATIVDIETKEADRASRLSGLIDRTAPKADEAPAADDTDDIDGDGGADVVAEAEAATKDAVTPVVAANFAASTRSDAPPALDPSDANRWTLASSAPNFSQHDGKQVDMSVIAEGITNPTGAFSGLRTDGAPTILARADRPQGPLVTTADEFYAELDRVTSEIPGQSTFDAQALVAAGGWCSPSVQLFGFDGTNPAQGLLSFPEMNIPRGGIIVPDEPDFTALQTGFHFTETELEADSGAPNYTPSAIKPIVEIPCVEAMTEYRKEAIGWGVKTGILQKRAWPELVKKFLDEFMVAHQQRISAKTLVKVLGKASAAKVVPTDVILGATSGVLNGLHQRARNIQIKRRTTTIGGIAPIWFRDVLKADLANREGFDVLTVTDNQVNSWLAARGIYLQYEGTWQSLTAGKPGNYDTEWWPGSVDVVLFPAGAIWRTLSNIVTVGAMYDITMLQQNRELVGFVEDEFQVGVKPSEVGSIHLIRIPLCVNGAVGARESIDCSSAYNTTVTKTVSFPGTPTGGGVTLKFGPTGTPSSSIAFNGTAGNADTALTAIDDGVISPTDITTAGGPFPAAVQITYPARLGDLQLGTNSLTGGTQPAAGVTIV